MSHEGNNSISAVCFQVDFRLPELRLRLIESPSPTAQVVPQNHTRESSNRTSLIRIRIPQSDGSGGNGQAAVHTSPNSERVKVFNVMRSPESGGVLGSEDLQLNLHH